jgi:hypothetical protein
MTDEINISDLSRRARQDSPPDIDVANTVLARLAVPDAGPRRVFGAFAVAASLLAVFVLTAAMWFAANRRDVRLAREELFGSTPSFVAQAQP